VGQATWADVAKTAMQPHDREDVLASFSNAPVRVRELREEAEDGGDLPAGCGGHRRQLGGAAASQGRRKAAQQLPPRLQLLLPAFFFLQQLPDSGNGGDRRRTWTTCGGALGVCGRKGQREIEREG
jgi:hypothetical protein